MPKQIQYVGVTIVTLLGFIVSCQTVSNFLISDEDEIKIGAKLYDQILSDKKNYPLYKDRQDYKSTVINYIENLGRTLSSVQHDRENVNFTFTIIDDDTTINAFAIPGGHIFVYTGLLREAENGAEVAGVMAHEIAHVTRYHGKQMLASSVAVGTINSILFGDSASVTAAAVGLLENMAFLKFSRNNEYEADSCSVVYTNKAGISPRGMASFFEKLQAKYPDRKVFEPLSTHPNTADRISKVNQIVGSMTNVATDLRTSEYSPIRSALGK